MAALFDAVSSILGSPAPATAAPAKPVPLTVANASSSCSSSSPPAFVELARPVPLSPISSNVTKSPAPHPASVKSSPGFSNSPNSGRNSPSFRLSATGRMSPPPAAMLECRLTYLDNPGKGADSVLRILDNATTDVIGSADFHHDACLAKDHIRVLFNERKATLTVELIANTPAYVLRKGSPNKQLLVKGKPVELFNLDRFTLIHDLHPVQVEICPQSIVQSRTGSNRAIIKGPGNEAERTGLLGEADRTAAEFKDTPTAF